MKLVDYVIDGELHGRKLFYRYQDEAIDIQFIPIRRLIHGAKAEDDQIEEYILDKKGLT